MTTEMCPRCRAARGMRVTASTWTVTGADGRKRIIRTEVLHCESCSSFVRSQDFEEDTAPERGRS